MQARIFACIHTAKAIAGDDHHALRRLIPLLLRHNALPTIEVPLQAFPAAGHSPRRRCRKQPEDTRAEKRAEDAHEPPAATESSESEAATSESEDEDEEEARPPPKRQLRLRPLKFVTATPRKSAAAKHEATETEDEDSDASHNSSPQNTAAKVHPSHSQPTVTDEGWVTKVKRQRRAKHPTAANTQHSAPRSPGDTLQQSTLQQSAERTPPPAPTTRTTRTHSTKAADTAGVQYVVKSIKIGGADVRLATPLEKKK